MGYFLVVGIAGVDGFASFSFSINLLWYLVMFLLLLLLPIDVMWWSSTWFLQLLIYLNPLNRFCDIRLALRVVLFWLVLLV